MFFRRVFVGAICTLGMFGSAQTTTLPHKQRRLSAADRWWRNAVIYEVYPRSFQDSDGDGIGDLNGVTQRLDYLETLGVNAIWLTPIYPSPQIDFGYDISDYTAIDPLYGTMADFDRLVREAGKRRIRVIMDLVLNHTSDRHPWFLESASSRTNAKRDWYIWRDGQAISGKNAEPPNNWINRINQTAWRYDAKTGQFMYHYYAPEQPDLNWRNPAVQKAMFEAARFWLDRGVAGYRLDAINTLFEDAALRDEPRVPGTNEYGEPSLSQAYQRNLPEVHDVLRDLRKVSRSYPEERLLIGEIYTQSTAELTAWYGKQKDELQLPMDTNVGFLNRLDAGLFRKRLEEAENTLGKGNTPLFVFDNHDRPRSWDRYGDGKHDEAIAKILAAILLGTRASSLIYQGEELGMETATPTRKEEVRDPRGLAGWPQEKGRDGERTPMQWNAGAGAGFSTTTRTWLPIEKTSVTKNVQVESADPQSLLNWYRRLIKLKQSKDAMRAGRTTYLDHDAQKALIWVREGKRAPSVMVACNMSAEPLTVDLAPELERLGYQQPNLKLLMDSVGTTSEIHTMRLTLRPYEVLVGQLQK